MPTILLRILAATVDRDECRTLRAMYRAGDLERIDYRESLRDVRRGI